MRKNQISITVERFGDQVPPEAGTTHQVISVYADSNNFSAALFEAIHALMDKVEGHVSIDESSCSVDVANLGAFTEAVNPQQRKHAANSALWEMKSSMKQAKLELFYAENVEEIVHVIAESEDRDDAIRRLSDAFDFGNEFEARKCFDASPTLSTKKDVLAKKRQIEELEERLALAQAQVDALEEAGI